MVLYVLVRTYRYRDFDDMADWVVNDRKLTALLLLYVYVVE